MYGGGDIIYWDSYARGSIFGITRGTKREHIIRAAQESIAFQSADLVAAMERDTLQNIKALHVDGGASRDEFLMQFQPDILGVRVVKPTSHETTALGAAYLAGLSTGVWKDKSALKNMQKISKDYCPNLSESESTVKNISRSV